MNVPGGTVNFGKAEFIIRTVGEFNSSQEMQNLVVRTDATGRILRLGTEDKRPAAEALLAELGLDWSQAAAMGDDWPDLPVMQRAAFACAPPQAHPEVLAVAHHVTQAAAGAGAGREFCDLLLVAGGHYRRLLDEVLA